MILVALACAPWPPVLVAFYLALGSPLAPMLGLVACRLVVIAVPEILRVTASAELAGNVLVGTIVGVCAPDQLLHGRRRPLLNGDASALELSAYRPVYDAGTKNAMRTSGMYDGCRPGRLGW